MSADTTPDPLETALALLEVDDHAFQGVVTKLRTTRGSYFALDVMKEGADRIDALTAALRALVAPTPATSGHPIRIAERVSRSHRTDYSTAGWRCECGHKYVNGVGGFEVEDHRVMEGVLAGLLAAETDGC